MKASTKSNLKFVLWALVYVLVIGLAQGWFSKNTQVTTKEEPVSIAAQKEYDWFIDRAKQIAKIDKDLKVSLGCVSKVYKQFEVYGNQKKWSSAITKEYDQLTKQCVDDLNTLASLRNRLVEEYNVASEKFNWLPFENRLDKPTEYIPGYVTF